METQHTPGPWRTVAIAGKQCGRRVTIAGANGKSIGDVWTLDAEGKDNASLIAAAPELLEALASTLNAMRDLLRQIPNDDRLADFNFGGCEFAEGQAIKALKKAGYDAEA